MSKSNLEKALAESHDLQNDRDKVVRTDVMVTRGHGRSRVLQVRLNDDEYAELERLADQVGEAGVPVSTLARTFLLQGMDACAGEAKEVSPEELFELISRMVRALADSSAGPVPLPVSLGRMALGSEV